MHRTMSSSYDTTRHVPIRYETDIWNRPGRWEMTPTFTPGFNTTPPFPTSSFPTSPFPTSSFPTSLPPPPPPPPEFGSSLVHYPSRERQSDTFEQEMRRMNNEMGKMFQNMQTAPSKPIGSVDDWRLSENFRLENPIITDSDGSRKFKLQFDVRQFKPEEIQVKTAGNTLTVQAKHEEKDPSKASFREYNRSYVLPKDVHPERLTSKLSVDGVLSIEAPLPSIEGPREKLIPIKHN